MLNMGTRCGKAWSWQPERLCWALGHSASAAREHRWVTTECPQLRDCLPVLELPLQTQVGAWHGHSQLAAPCWGRLINSHKLHPRRCPLIKYDLVGAGTFPRHCAPFPDGSTDVEGMVLGLRHRALGGEGEAGCACVLSY